MLNFGETASQSTQSLWENAVGSFSIWHWLVVIFWIAVVLVPAWRITKKAGFSPALSLLTLVPVVNVVAIWVFAFVKWPSQREAA